MGGIGPVEYVVIAFPGNRFKGEIVPAIKARRQRARWQQEADAQAQQAPPPAAAAPARRSTWSPSCRGWPRSGTRGS